MSNYISYVKVGSRTFTINADTATQLCEREFAAIKSVKFSAKVTVTRPGWKPATHDTTQDAITCYEGVMDILSDKGAASEAAYYARREAIGREMETFNN